MAPKPQPNSRKTRSSTSHRAVGPRSKKAATAACVSKRASASSAAPPAPSDPSTWRSRVRSDSRITKTNALKLYRIKEAALTGLSFERSSTVVNGQEHPMYLYLERDVERKAWEVRGGPERLSAYFKTLYERHKKRNTKNTFQCPEAYRSWDIPPSMSIGRLPPYKGTVEKYLENRQVGSSPTLLHIKQTMASWFWKECTENWDPLDDEFPSQKFREDAMLDAQAFFLEYPLRPAQLLPSSPAVDALRARLNGAPNRKDASFGDPVPGLEYNDGGFNGDPAFYEWGDEFMGSVYHALDDVIKAHGMGAEGWANVRWEVYDKYVKCVGGGPWHTRDCNRIWHWVDDAKRWLEKDDLMRGLSKYCSTAA